MASKTVEIEERVAGLSKLMAAAKKTLVGLGQGDDPPAKRQRANLQLTIATVERELVLARQSLQGARELDAAAETLTRLMQGRLAVRSGQTQIQAQDRTVASDAIKAILTSANTKAKNRKPK